MTGSKMGDVLLTFMRVIEVDVRWWLWVFALRFDES